MSVLENDLFNVRVDVKEVEEGDALAPKFDGSGLISVVTTDFKSGELLMHAYMNKEALIESIKTGEAVYWSRSRKTLWRKGATSGFVQKIKQMAIDDDQDCIWLRVQVSGGASCHVGYRSCFYREVPTGLSDKELHKPLKLRFLETNKIFDPKKVYGDAPNPTKL